MKGMLKNTIGVSKEELQNAIFKETEILLRENRELIVKRAHKSLREKFLAAKTKKSAK